MTTSSNKQRLSLSQSLDIVNGAFAAEYRFHSFLPHNATSLSKNDTWQAVSKGINKKIIEVLNAIVHDGLALDVALAQINALINYARATACLLDDNSLLCSYYDFMFYFFIFGCCLGTKYTKLMILTKQTDSDTSNPLLTYFIGEYLSNWPSSIHYAYAQSKRNSMIAALQHKAQLNDIAVLIADYTSFEFEELFYCATKWTHDFDKTCGLKLLGTYWSYMRFPEQSRYNVFILPKLLLCPTFINIENDLNLKYFANRALFRTIYWNEASKHGNMIGNLYFHLSDSVQPENDAYFSLECSDEYNAVFGSKALMKVLKQEVKNINLD